MGQFKPMVKMYTDEPSMILKLKKGGKVHHKETKKQELAEHGHKSMHHHAMSGMHHAFESEHGSAPKKPSMSERRKAMNPNQYKKGGKVEHKLDGGMMGAPMGAPMAPMARPQIAAMDPRARMARAMQVRKALTGMKKGGHMGMEKHIEKLEKELHHHESMPMEKAHKMHHKASGGAIDRDETKTTIKGNAKKFEKTMVVDGQHHDKHHGTGEIHEGKPAGFKHGGKMHKMHHKATGGAIPSDTHEKVNKGKIKMHGTIEGNEHDYLNTEMHSAKRDKAHGTGGIKETNAGGFKHGGKIHHKATGGAIPAATMKGMKEDRLKGDTYEDGDWENRAADTATRGKMNGKTGQVNESNAGGFKHGGHAAKKHYATGGNVVDDGKAVKMPHHFVSRPVANSLQSGTFAKGGKVDYYSDLAKRLQKNPEKPNLRLVKTHTGPKGHVAKVYKDKDYGEYRTKFYTPEGKHLTEGDSHTDDAEDAHMTAMHEVNRGYKRGGRATKKFDGGGSTSDDQFAQKANQDYANWEKAQRAENEADKNMIPNAIKSGVNAIKNLFSSKETPKAPAKKRGGSMRKC
jgi:hypothetical protein